MTSPIKKRGIKRFAEFMFESFLEHLDLSLNVLFTLLCMLFVLVQTLSETPVRIILGLLLILFLPGYSLIAILFTRKNDLEHIERIAFSFGLSIAVVPLLGLALNFTPFGIRLVPILILISTFTISFSLIAWVRRMKLSAEERFRVPFKNLLKFKTLFVDQTSINKSLSLILITSIIASSAALFYIIAKPKTSERFTEFYLLGPNGKAFDYPTDLKVEENGKMIIGIVNHEYENVTYRLEVNFNGFMIHEEPVFLIYKETWESRFTFKVTKKGENQKLEFLLYKEQQIEAYRILHLWISVT